MKYILTFLLVIQPRTLHRDPKLQLIKSKVSLVHLCPTGMTLLSIQVALQSQSVPSVAFSSP